MSDRTDLIHRSLDGDLSEADRAELREALAADAVLAQELARFEELQEGLQSLNEEPGGDLTDKIMRALPERPDPLPFHRWILQPIRVPAWALGALGLLLVGGTLYIGRVGVTEVKPVVPATASAAATAMATDKEEACPVPRVMVRFLLKAPEASKVSLAGDFNDWSVEQTALSDEDGNGIWTVTVPLQPGRYQYKFLLDGKKWVVEPDAPAYQSDGFGGKNSLLVI